ncbi:ABC transporter substrate-binding protein [Sinomonas terrae]|uniref:Extracellular solute-binding protein n=1 Tax=Sinomonas terrae TaxID=2908838 RepID=A0ABS9U6R8_9MICC|nr:extracellular solute-binding protein [Sinomonas terrae]MCH6472385.1 extracellular solute-binding protein [Sinomonas terrae]
MKLLQENRPRIPRVGSKSVRRGLAVAGAAGLAIGMAACGSTGPGQGTGPSGTAPITTWAVSSGGTDNMFQDSFTAWNKAHPSEQINASYFATDAYKDKIRTAIGSDQAPTLIYTWGGGVLKGYVDANKVMDLSDIVKQNPSLKDKFTASVAAGGVIDGKTYAIPMAAVTPVHFYYNKDVLAKAGVQPPQTWDDLLAAIPKIKATGAAPISLGGGSKWPYLMWEEYLVDRLGGPDVFKNILANKPNAWSDPAVIKANTMIQQLVDAGAFVNGFSSVQADSSADLALLVSGKAGMLLQGAWDYPSVSQIDPKFISSGKLGYGAFPAVPGGQGDPKDVAGNPSSYWAISSKATPAQVKTAVDYLVNGLWDQGYTDRMINSGEVPPLKGLDDRVQKAGDFPAAMYKMMSDAPSFQMSWDLALAPAPSAAFWTQLDLLFNKAETPQQFSDNMNKTIGQ